jgi:hypothetical protein
MSLSRNFSLAKTGAMLTIAAALMAPTAFADNHGEAAGPNTGNISFSGSLEVSDQYWFRGIFQENQGLVAQPGFDLSFALNETISLYVGTWNSLHTHDDTDTWYEADWYGGISITLPANLSLDVSYIVLYNPDGGDAFAEEIDVALAYDDSENPFFFGIAISPYVLVAFETQAGSDGDTSNEGIYLELGVEPSFTLVDSPDAPITLSIPMVAGFSIDDYYELDSTGDDETWGFVEVAAVLSMPLTGMPSTYGSWSVHGGVHFLFLNDDSTGLLADSLGSDDSLNIYGKFGISFDY